MRAWMVAIVVVAACKSGKDAGKTTDVVKNAASAAIPVPTVSVATVLAKDDSKPPLLLILDPAGTARLAAASTWSDLDANKLQVAKKVVKLDVVDKYTRETYAMGREPLAAVKEWDELAGTDIDLTALEDTKPTAADQDDPPPPPPEDEADESGGTGTAMALDEGKMGKKDSDRAEGQYKMKADHDDPQLARQQAIEQARAAGVLGSSALGGGGGAPGAFSSDRPNEDGTPSRVAQAEGVVMKDGKLDRLRALILIPPTAKATVLIDAVRDTGDAIGVTFNGKIRPLHLEFSMRDTMNMQTSPYWIEARVSSKSVVVEAVPDKPTEVSALDQLGAAMQQAQAARGREPESVDVLVDPDVDVQRLVDVIVALDVAGATSIGIGPAPSAEQLARRGHRIPTLAIGQPNAQGNLDKAEIRKVVKGAVQKIRYCYEKALVTSPTLEGTVQVQFYIKPDGTVPSAAASGVDPGVAACVENVIKSLTFPKPAGGAGAQVNYPFTMRH